MKVAIASIGRFYVLDLARELDALGIETLFYSYVPRNRSERFGLPAHCHRGLLPLVAPFVAWQYGAGSVMPALQEKAMALALNAAVIARLKPCDVFICMSGIYLEAARYARRRFGARIYLERASQHILSQRDILKSLGEARVPSDFIVHRELEGYALADRIAVPSTHVVESFREQDPELEPKLFQNHYGVDLEQFPQRGSNPPADPPIVLFVGGWSHRKGVDVLVKAIRLLKGVRLLHVGGIVDVPFPTDDPRFEHVDSVPQWRLKEFYAKAHVFALSSREDGFGVVLSQALASGLPLACTSKTGGRDLMLSPVLAGRILVTEPDDAPAFAAALSDALALARLPGSLPPLNAEDRALLSWSAYGKRYFDELNRQFSYRQDPMVANS